METDYSCYAIVHELKHGGQDPHAALQLLSGCQAWGRAPTAPRGQGGTGQAPGGRQGLGSPPPPQATTLAPNMLTPRHPQGIHFGVNE